jgi:hypothetical protein
MRMMQTPSNMQSWMVNTGSPLRDVAKVLVG